MISDLKEKNIFKMGEQPDITTTQLGVKFINKVKKKRPLKKHIKPKYVKRLSSFELEYSKLGDKLLPEKKFIDYILVHPETELVNGNEDCRQKFECKLLEEGFHIDKEVINGNVYKIIRCSFKRLCVEAERVRLQMPLSQGKLENFDDQNCLTTALYNYFATDDTVDYVSAPFIMEKIHWFYCYEDPSQFFRPALRSLLTHLILISLDYRDEKSHSEKDQSEKDQSEKDLRGLLYLLKHEVYHDSFILHDDIDELEQKTVESQKSSEDKTSSDTKSESYGHVCDSRHTISKRWTVFWKFQPLWKIRNYFGEKIAFYFAWTGMLMTSLWFPTLFGIFIFCYGLNLRCSQTDLCIGLTNSSGFYNETSTIDQIKRTMNDVLLVIRESFDNNITPYFALIICLWEILLLPNVGSILQISVLRVCLVGASVIGVIVYRVIMSIEYSDNVTEIEGFMITTIASSFLNAVSILLLGTVYTKLANKLTCWENHRTKSSFDDALIIKLFAFHFVNSYSSCFYIAFIRGRFLEHGIMGMGASYQDKCEGSCMSQLSIQVMILMLTKPFPKFLKDVIIPQVIKIWRRIHVKGNFDSKVNNIDDGVTTEGENKKAALETWIQDEERKPVLGDFTLEEFTEKTIQYGYLMLFAASFPLAPLIALITNFIDVRVDANRLLWTYRRPLAFISQDIGMWYPILRFINTVGVISNAFLIAFTSHWSETFSLSKRLWVVIGFEHIVYGVKLLIEIMIPDTTAYVKMVRRQNKMKVSERLKCETKDYHNIVPQDSHRSWFDCNGQLKAFKEPILEEPPEKRNSCSVEDETSSPIELSHSTSCNLSTQKQHRLKRKSLHATEMLNKQKKGSVADDEDDGDSDSAAAKTRDRIINRNRPHSLATAGSISLSLGNHPASNL
ncbi:anoctamin-7 [Octopus bimaculoides]|uniref:anoctamin-7 n=1 Tax=Octopus bimaculoides TaxID=37653 RepID=UPI0022E1235B|nr:anoctamin-7 [Octopus bimaculoides]